MQHNLNALRNKSTSPTSVPLPISPQSSLGEFDALIELVASDEAPVSSLNLKPDAMARGGQTDLRDANGQLDFSKIKNMFASSNSGTRTRQRTVNTTEIFEIGQIQAGTPDDSRVIFSTPTSPLRTSSIPTLDLLSDSHTTINSRVFDAGLPPAESTPIPTSRTLQGGNMTVTSSFDPSWNTQLEANDVLPVITQRNSECSTSPLSSLKRALDLAQCEVVDLRKRCSELEDQHASEISFSGHNLDTVGRNSPTSPPRAQALQVDISNLPTNLISTPSSDDILRALEMVVFVDELVWKRSRFGATYSNPYGAQNVQALKERLELWEHAVRTRR